MPQNMLVSSMLAFLKKEKKRQETVTKLGEVSGKKIVDILSS
jgi:hypothetical protein